MRTLGIQKSYMKEDIEGFQIMKIGDKIPEILGIDQNGREIKASDYRGKKLVLYRKSLTRAKISYFSAGRAFPRKAGFRTFEVRTGSIMKNTVIRRNESSVTVFFLRIRKSFTASIKKRCFVLMRSRMRHIGNLRSWNKPEN